MKTRSMRAAINAMCKQCLYDPLWHGGGNWRQQVQACTDTKCPLYELRPISKPKRTASMAANDDQNSTICNNPLLGIESGCRTA
jgi:hypothetical protein